MKGILLLYCLATSLSTVWIVSFKELILIDYTIIATNVNSNN